VLDRELTCKGQMSSELQACGGDEVAEGSWDIWVEAGECPDTDSVHRPAWPCGKPRSPVMLWRLPTTFQGADGRFP
jgi:hypothetical protein